MLYLSGQALLEEITATYPDIPAIVMTATHDLETAVQCMRAGALDYLAKPVDKDRLVSSVRRALELRALREEVCSLKERLLSDTPPARGLCRDRDPEPDHARALSLCRSHCPVAAAGAHHRRNGYGQGADGAGRASARRPRGDFVAVNVAGLDDQVFSDTLFGHTRGAFTGADRPRDGLITCAEEGTLFLDEIGDLAAVSQVKLLRLLQEGTYYPLGADRPRQSRARLVVATNRDVVQDVHTGTFRKDLYYRLRAHHLQLPPLRARRDDLALLVNHCLAKAAAALHKPVPTPPLALYQLLNTYTFPGNVRELEAMVFDAVARHQGGSLSLQAFKDAIGAERPLLAGDRLSASALPALGPWEAEPLPTLHEAEEALMAAALRQAAGNQGVAAGLLGLSRQALNKRLRRRPPRLGPPPAEPLPGRGVSPARGRQGTSPLAP